MCKCTLCGLMVRVTNMLDGEGYCPWCKKYTVDLKLHRYTKLYIKKYKRNRRMEH